MTVCFEHPLFLLLAIYFLLSLSLFPFFSLSSGSALIHSWAQEIGLSGSVMVCPLPFSPDGFHLVGIVAQSASVAGRHPWLPGRERLREGVEQDAQLIRKILLQQAALPTPADKKIIATLWFWHTVYSCWAEAQVGTENENEPLRVSYVARVEESSGEPSLSGG